MMLIELKRLIPSNLCLIQKEMMMQTKKAIEKVKHLLKPKGQFLFTAPFGVHGEVKNFERVYDLKDINSMFKGFKITSMHTYAVINYKIVQEIPIKEAEKMNHDEANHTYAVICIDAEKT